ncbi:hypothetical protein EGJ48_16785 [Pantoea dispersa]|nr:hypothetical protein EGJ48_16785 [Pantoea dispersa]
MIPTMMNTHKAFKALQQAGVADHQAEVMVDIFAEMQQENSLTKTHLSQAMEGVMRANHATSQRVDKLAQSLRHLENEVRHTFKAIELRFDNVDEQFRKIDQRFEQIDQRFEKMDAQFKQIDKRLEKVDAQFRTIDQRFEQIDERFRQIDKRFEKVDERLLDLDHRMQLGFNELKRDNLWHRRLMMAMASAFVLSAAKYIFAG